MPYNIDENTTPMSNAPKELSMGNKEGICISSTGQPDEGFSSIST